MTGAGWSEKDLGYAASPDMCFAKVKFENKEANGVRFRKNDNTCFAQFNVSGNSADNGSWGCWGNWPKKTFDYIGGTGTGGPEQYLTNTATAEECFEAVWQQINQNGPGAGGATWYYKGGMKGQCYYLGLDETGVHRDDRHNEHRYHTRFNGPM